MKRKLPIPLIPLCLLTGILSCNSPAATDPKAKLEELQKKQLDINEQITKLEKTLPKGDKMDSSQINYKQVSFTPLLKTHFVHTIQVQGKVTSDKNIEVNPKTTGIVTRVLVTEGQRVHQGQTLAIIDDQILKANLEQVKSQYGLATILFQKQKNLWDQQIGTEVQYLQAKNNKENLEKNLSLIREQISQTNIVSPISGTVDQVQARVGQVAAMGAPQFRIVNTEVLKIVAGLGENYLSQVKVGSPLSLEFPDLKKKIKSRVEFVSSSIDPITRTFMVQTQVRGMSGIKPEMVAIFNIQDYQNSNAMVVPINIVQNSEEGSFVYVAEKGTNPKFGTAKKKLVKLGLVQGDKVEIKSGLVENDLVIMVGYQGLTQEASLRF